LSVAFGAKRKWRYHHSHAPLPTALDDRGEQMATLTVREIRKEIQNLPDDIEIDFGQTLAGKPLVFYRFKRRDEKVLHIELNEADSFSATK